MSLSFVVGQEVCVTTFGSYESTTSYGWTVTKITPTGQVTAARHHPVPGTPPLEVKRFYKDGREIGDPRSYNLAQLYADVVGCRAKDARRASQIKAQHALSADAWTVRSTTQLSMESMNNRLEVLRSQLAAAEAAVAAYAALS